MYLVRALNDELLFAAANGAVRTRRAPAPHNRQREHVEFENIISQLFLIDGSQFHRTPSSRRILSLREGGGPATTTFHMA